MLHIRLLGNFSITHNHEPVTELTRPQLKTLLAYLALQGAAPTAREKIALLLWPVSGETQAKTNLRNLLSELRQKFLPIEEYLEITSNTLRWKPTAATLFDIAEFEATLQDATQANDIVLQQVILQRALDLYTGDLWPECREEWIFAERERLRSLYSGALERMIDLLDLQRHYAGALRVAQYLLQYTPPREENYRRIMRLYACLGDRAGVDRTFQECQMLLTRTLRVTPSLPTLELYERLTQAVLAVPPLASLPFVERRAEWVQLQSAWQDAQQGKSQCILLTGDAGIGKTRLLAEFRTSVERHGLAAVAAHCHPFTLTVAYAPLLDWLRTPLMRRRITTLAPIWRNELVQLLPELQPEPASFPAIPVLESWQRQRLYEALAHLFLAPEPLLLLIDDVQWCDQSTIDWLHYLWHVAPTAKLLLVGALSSIALRPHYPLTTWRPQLQQYRLIAELHLTPLTEEGVATLGSVLAGELLPATVSTLLYAVTEGNPLYVVEALHTTRLTQPNAIADGLLQSPRVQATLDLYFAPLSVAARDVLGLAATIGRTFAFDLLALATLLPREALLLALDELLQYAIVRDAGEAAYTFCHPLLQKTAYAALTSAKRRLWQERVAHAHERLGQA